MTWINSYKNHILYSSIYVGVASSAFASAVPVDSLNLWDFLLLFVGSIAILCFFWEIKYVSLRIGLPPGDSGAPILGILPKLLAGGPLKLKLDAIQQFGTPFTCNLIMKPIVVFTSDEDIRWCLTQERKGNLVPYMMDFAKNLVGEEAILFQHSSSHRRLRRIFEPSFAPAAVNECVQILDTTICEELEKWSNAKEFCSSTEWAMLAMRLFFVCAVGDDLVDDPLLEKLSNLFHEWIEGFKAPIPLAIPGTTLHMGYVAKKALGEVLQDLIDAFMEKNPPGSAGAEKSMMGRLCYHGADDGDEPLSKSQLIINMQLILFAGHDTTKGSFSAFGYYLSDNPKVRDLLTKEVQSFSEPLDPEELKSAPVLNAFLAETWRLVPPLDAHATLAVKDLEYKGYKIRKGVCVSADLQASNILYEDQFPNPREFRIERWLPTNHPLHDPKYFQQGVDYNIMSPQYRTFNMGPHMCLGGHFAKLEARIVLTRLLQRYDVEIRNNHLVQFPLRQYENEFRLSKRERLFW